MAMSSIAKVIATLVATLSIAACGGSSSGPQGPTVSGVSVQSRDVPPGMVRCDLTGDINNFISKEQSPDPQTAKSMGSYWAEAKKAGATAAYAAVYTDSDAHCTSIKSSTSDPAAASYKVVINFVTQFKDEKSAASAYTNESLFGFSSSSLRAGGGQPIEGTKTGLTANSLQLTQTVSNQSFYIALWQSKTFVVILVVLNVDATASKKIATSENGRIK
jgi:hypothetical protein